jgi:hypothetical protein
VFALFLSGTSKFKELIIEVTFEVGHGGKSKDANFNAVRKRFDCVAVYLRGPPRRGVCECGSNMPYVEGIALYCNLVTSAVVTVLSGLDVRHLLPTPSAPDFHQIL